jgi:hypothetical protein
MFIVSKSADSDIFSPSHLSYAKQLALLALKFTALMLMQRLLTPWKITLKVS